jgi:hypothetical protein
MRFAQFGHAASGNGDEARRGGKPEDEAGRARVPAATERRPTINVCHKHCVSAQRSHRAVNPLADVRLEQAPW